MARTGLALYLVLSTAVGPSLCCCLPDDLFSLCTAPKEPSSAHRHCCGHDAAHHRHRAANTTQAPDMPTPAAQRDCPCKEDQPQPVAFELSGNLSPLEAARCLMVSHWTIVGVPVLGDVLLTQGKAPRESISCPFCNSRDILSALHILRC
jgi:hypothetical protein